MSQFVNNYNYILDIESAKSHVENLLIIDIEEIKILVIEGLKTEEEFSRKAVMLEEERIAAMKKFSCISISASLCFACLLLIVQEQVKEGASHSKGYFKKV